MVKHKIVIDSEGEFEGYTLLSIKGSDYELVLYLINNEWKKSRESLLDGFDEYGEHISLKDEYGELVHLEDYLGKEIGTGLGNVIHIDTLSMEEYFTG